MAGCSKRSLSQACCAWARFLSPNAVSFCGVIEALWWISLSKISWAVIFLALTVLCIRLKSLNSIQSSIRKCFTIKIYVITAGSAASDEFSNTGFLNCCNSEEGASLLLKSFLNIYRGDKFQLKCWQDLILNGCFTFFIMKIGVNLTANAHTTVALFTFIGHWHW